MSLQASNPLPTVEVVSIPEFCGSRSWGKYAAMMAELHALGDGKCLKICPPLTTKQRNALDHACRYRGLRIRTSKTPEASYVWVKERGVGNFPSIAKVRPTSGVML